MFDLNSARYKLEEWWSELWDLAHIGIPDSDRVTGLSNFWPPDMLVYIRGKCLVMTVKTCSNGDMDDVMSVIVHVT